MSTTYMLQIKSTRMKGSTQIKRQNKDGAQKSYDIATYVKQLQRKSI